MRRAIIGGDVIVLLRAVRATRLRREGSRARRARRSGGRGAGAGGIPAVPPSQCDRAPPPPDASSSNIRTATADAIPALQPHHPKGSTSITESAVKIQAHPLPLPVSQRGTSLWACKNGPGGAKMATRMIADQQLSKHAQRHSDASQTESGSE